PRTALLAPHALHSLLDLVPAARILKRHGWRIAVVDPGVGAQIEAICAADGFDYRGDGAALPAAVGSGTDDAAPPAAVLGRRRLRRLLDRIPGLGGGIIALYAFGGELRRQSRLRRHARRLLDELRPDVAVVFN